ncbi:unnamed protein product [Moneuplotes crassus]|uniref:Short-chain dehydrogenase/reductase 3 n=1 Tax=Euplotes crassus TaxID=5936 RepID=A0AAD1XNU5_EUPCR|nr:unnamed protein product [Moneuplotes crassus]
MIGLVFSTFGYFGGAVFLFVVIRLIYSALKNNGLLLKKSVKGEHVFMTGGGAGIGKLMCFILAKQGAKVTVTDINQEWAEQTAKEVKEAGGEAVAVKCDVTVVDDITKAAKVARDTFGDVTILINNAGIVTGKKILETSHQLAEKTLQVNTLAHIYTVKEFLPSMIKKNHGHIVSIASSAGLVGCPGLVDYCASKYGAVGFDESLRLEVKKIGANINTTCICPTFIKTDMFKGAKANEFLVPLLEPDWIAERIVLAIRQNESMLMTPFISNTIYLTRALLPTFFLDLYMKAIGVNESMDHFSGRNKD